MNNNTLKNLIKEQIKSILNEGEHDQQNYMFFQNLHTIKKMIDKMLELNPQEVDTLLSNGHAWAVDHISTSTDDVSEVATWLCNELSNNSNNMMNETEEQAGEFINTLNNPKPKSKGNWETVYTWLKLFSTDKGNFLNSHNITSGIWLKKALDTNQVTPAQLDMIAKSNGKVFSTLPMVQDLTN